MKISKVNNNTNKKFEIIMDFIKDISFEIPSTDAYISSAQDLEKYQTKIDIKNNPISNKVNELNLKIFFEAPQNIKNKIHAEICLAIIFKILEQETTQDEVKKIILADIPNLYSEKITNTLSNIFQQSGFKEFKFKKKINFVEMYESQKKTSLSN
jgi:preprotein translocase subunit SecB